MDRKTAAVHNGYSISGLDTAVKKGTITQGYYYKIYSDCDNSLITDFEEKYGKEILLYKEGLGMFNESGLMVKEYKCKYDCIKYEKMSDKTLAKCLQTNKPYNGILYKELPSKLSCY